MENTATQPTSQTITLWGINASMYHLFNRSGASTREEPHTADKIKVITSGHATVTGWHPGALAAGDMLKFHPNEDVYVIDEILERRNHAGEFTDPELKIGSFFKVKCHFEHTFIKDKDKPKK